MKEIWNLFSKSNKILTGVLVALCVSYFCGVFYVNNKIQFDTLIGRGESLAMDEEFEAVRAKLNEKLTFSKFDTVEQLNKEVQSVLDDVKKEHGDILESIEFKYNQEAEDQAWGYLEVTYKGVRGQEGQLFFETSVGKK